MSESNKHEIEGILQRLDEKFLDKEIDETIYNELKAKYEKQLKEKITEDAEKSLVFKASPTTLMTKSLVDVRVEEPKKISKIRTGKKIVVAATVLVVFALIISWIAWISWIEGEREQREALQNVQVLSFDVQSVRFGLTSISADLSVTLYNPNSRITATLDRMDYMIYVNGNYFTNGYISQRIDISPMSTKTVSTPLQVSYSGALSTVWSVLMSGGKISWGLRGTAYFDTPIGTMNVPISQDGIF